jgi:hypothetical protein
VSRGRTPFTVGDVQPYGTPNGRLKPPASLGEKERKVFLDLVSTTPSTQFLPADMPLLCRWCELTVLAEQAFGEFTAVGVVQDGKESPWVSVYERAVRGLTMVGRQLRLGPGQRMFKAPKKVAASLSYYDRLKLEEGDDDVATSN